MTNSCQLCNTLHKTCGGLASHLIQTHKISTKNYYDQFIKKNTEGICKNCGVETKFHNLSLGYRVTCSQKCSRKLMSQPESRNKAKVTMLSKYGVEHAAQNVEVKSKISSTQKERLKDPEEKKRISIATKEAMQRDDVKEKLINHHNKPVPDEVRLKQSIAAKNRYEKDPSIKEKIYTEDRNKKISISKKKYWETHSEEKVRVGEMWKKLKEKDEFKWRSRLLEISKKGFETIFGGNGQTSLEIKMYAFLDLNKIKYVSQYEIEYKLFDAYLPDYNVLLEFDGEFWHKLTIEECKYSFQVQSFYNDQLKNDIAKKKNIPLYRIRENDDPSIILDIISRITH